MALNLFAAFDKARAILTSADAERFALSGVTLRTERGLVEFYLVDGDVRGREVAA